MTDPVIKDDRISGLWDEPRAPDGPSYELVKFLDGMYHSVPVFHPIDIRHVGESWNEFFKRCKKEDENDR